MIKCRIIAANKQLSKNFKETKKMKTKKLAFYLLACILGGCIPVMSLHPLYTEKNLAFDEKLLGTWVQKELTETGELRWQIYSISYKVEELNGAENIWDFKRADANEKAYICSDKEGKGLFIAHLVKLKDKLFLDVCPAPWEQMDPNKTKTEWVYNHSFLIPAHTFIKIDSIEPQLKMRRTDDEKMKEFLKADPNVIEHTSIEDKPVLTASTQKLQAFVLKYADDNRVFSEEIVLTRKKTKAPQESVKQKPNEPNDIGPK
jgi:hypothetical protein